MSKTYQIAELRSRLIAAKERLTLERTTILQLYPLKNQPDRSAYGFAYKRAEHLCITAIKTRLEEIQWLPAKLDTSTDISANTRDRMARWIKQGENIIPGEEIFGNAFIHTLAHCAIQNREERNSNRLADRIAILFRDLTSLVAAIHCCNICQEFELDEVELSAPHDISRIALDLTITTETLLAMAEEELAQDEAEEEFTAADNENKQQPPAYLRLVETPPEHPAR